MQKISRIGRFWFLILIFLFQLSLQAQNKKYFVITGQLDPELKEASNGNIEITKNGKETSNIEISKNGRFRLELEFFNEYSLNFKYPGHFSKIIIISTDIPQEVWARDNDFPPFPMVVQLLKEFEGVDKSFTLKPSGRIFYEKDIDNFRKEGYITDIQFIEQIETAKTKANQVQKESNLITKENAQDLAAKQKNFDQLIKEADASYQRGEYQMALAKYLDAQKLFPDKKYPNDRVAELQDLVKALEITERQKAELEQKYKAAIAKANGLFDQKSYRDARPVYDNALQYKPGDVYANGRITEIDQLLALLEKQKQYKDLIAQADINYKSKSYDKAIALYNQAKLAVPEEQYPQNQINQINQDLQQQASLEQLEKDFNQAIQTANMFVQQKDYLQALNSYKKALGLKPDNKLAKDKIAEIEQTIVAVETENKYQQAIKLADLALAASDLQKAKLQYLEALKLKSGESYPKNKLAEITKTEGEEIKFNELVAKAEIAFTSNNFDESLNLFTQALEIKPKNPTVQKRIDDIQNLKKQQLTDKEYADLIVQADQSFQNSEMDASLSSYNKALLIKKTEAYPKDQIKKIGIYQSLIKKADKLFDSKDYSGSTGTFNEVLVLKPMDTYATGKIAEIEKILKENKRIEDLAKTELAANMEKQNLAFNQAMASGDKSFTENDFNAAKIGYQTALSIKPNDPTAKDKLGQTEAKLAQLVRMTLAYNKVIDEANKQFTGKQYKEAKAKYQEALQYLPESDYPKLQIAKIDELLSKQEAEAKTQQDFNLALTEGEALLKNKELTKAKDAFMKAYNLIPSETVPPKRIAEINVLLASQAQKDSELKVTLAAYQEAVRRADKHFGNKEYNSAQLVYKEALLIKTDEKYPSDQLVLIEKLLKEQSGQNYKNAITKADIAFDSNQFTDATSAYQEALTFKKDDLYATKRLKEIEQKIADIEAENSRLKKLQDEFNATIADAGNDFMKKEYQKSKGKYQKALTLKPEEALPKEQIAKIDQLLSELLNVEETNRQYALAIKTAEDAFRVNKLKEARDAYQVAANLKPLEPMPPLKISEIDKINKMLAAQNVQQDSIQKAKDRSFDLAMAAAKEHEQNQRYEQAIQKYTDAIQIKPDQKSVIQQLIREIQNKMQLLAKQEADYKRIIKLADNFYVGSKLNEAITEYNNALTIKTEEDYPKEQIKKIQALLTAIEENYSKAISTADKAFDVAEWGNAKTGYTEALGIKPKETYPASRLKEVNQKISDANLALISKSAENKAFRDAMEKAEKSFQNDQLPTARMQFLAAQKLKPDEKLPAERIKEIDALIDQRDKDRLAQAQRQIDEKYRLAISVADNSFREKSYTIAKLQYKQALIIKPDESYPNDQITLIDKLLNEVKPVETYATKLPETAKPIAKPLYNPAESVQATETRAQSFNTIKDFDEAITKADASYGIKDYTVARFYYYKANEIKPDEEYPKTQIELIRKLIDSQLSSNDVSDYDNNITQADAAFAKENYSVSKFYYYKALEIKSWEKYPKDRINEILALTHSLLSEKEEKEYRDIIAKADEAYINKDIAIARFSYNKAISIKKDENYPRIKLKDIQKLIEQDKRDQENLEYRKLIDDGDQAFKFENFSAARFSYNRALELKPDEKYPKDQLRSIKEALVKKEN